MGRGKRLRLPIMAATLLIASCSTGDGYSTSIATSLTTTTQATTTTVAATTTTASPVNEQWVPVGGSEYHDSQDRLSDSSSPALDHAGSRYQQLVADIDEARKCGELHLGAIDRFWTDALGLLYDREDEALVNGLLTQLAADRDALLDDLPASLETHRGAFAAALIDRDLESRIAAYEVLDFLVTSGDDLGFQGNMIWDLHFLLGEEVKSTLLRREALASGRTGPELDPTNLPDLPDRILLLQWTDGLYWADLVVLVDLNGEPIGYLDGHTLMGPNAATIAGGEVLYGVSPQGISADPVEGCVVSHAEGDTRYLICDDTTTYRNPARRAEVRVDNGDGTAVRVVGAAVVYEDHPSDPVVGRWRGVIPSPDGSALLGQWSGECETPSAHMIYQGDVSERFRAGDDDIWPESWALGWREDGRALVVATAGACSSLVDKSGVFLWSLTGAIEPLYPTSTGGVSARLIRPNDPLPIAITEVPIEFAMDARIQFHGHETSTVQTATGSVTTGFTKSSPLVAFSCDGMQVFIGPGVPGELTELLGMVDEYAGSNRCVPAPGPIYECLGVESDPAVCSD